MEHQRFYDSLISIIITNLQATAKDKTISLGHFDFKNKNHLCIYQAARIAHDILGYTVTVDMPLLSFWYFKKKYYCKKTIQRKKDVMTIDCPELIKNIERANNASNILAKIYEAYYEQ